MLQSKDTEWQTGLKKKKKTRDYNMQPSRGPTQGKGHTD